MSAKDIHFSRWPARPRPARGRAGGGVLALCGVLLLLGLALPVALPGAETSASAPPKSGNQAAPGDMCLQVVPSPNQSTTSNYLFGVDAISANDVWAVGTGQQTMAMAMHWDGSIWQLAPTPDPGGTQATLHDVAAVASNDVWAAGYFVDDAWQYGLIERWNGSNWSIVTNPSPPGTILMDIEAVSADDVWAVGWYNDRLVDRTLILHWNGTEWNVVPNSVIGMLQAASALSVDDVWAVGSYRTYRYTVDTLTMHWNGTQWTVVPSPNAAAGIHNSGVWPQPRPAMCGLRVRTLTAAATSVRW